MSPLPVASIQCPCCWETIEVLVDPSVEQQDYTEDCSVCCRPIHLSVRVRDGEVVSLEARSEDELNAPVVMTPQMRNPGRFERSCDEPHVYAGAAVPGGRLQPPRRGTRIRSGAR